MLLSVPKEKARGAEMKCEKEEVGKEVPCVVRIHEGAQHRGMGAKDRGEKKGFFKIGR